MNITAEYGCCFNTFVAEFYGRRYKIMVFDTYVFMC